MQHGFYVCMLCMFARTIHLSLRFTSPLLWFSPLSQMLLIYHFVVAMFYMFCMCEVCVRRFDSEFLVVVHKKVLAFYCVP